MNLIKYMLMLLLFPVISNAKTSSWYVVNNIFKRCEALPSDVVDDKGFQRMLVKDMKLTCRRVDNPVYRYVEFLCTNGVRNTRAIIFKDKEQCENYMRGTQID